MPATPTAPRLMTGNEAAAWGARLAEAEYAPVFPITPQTEIIEAVTDDVCGEVGGGLGLRSGVYRMVETGHTKITVFEDRFQVIDVENGTFSYDFDDPSIPDVSGYRYSSPFSAVVNKNDNVLITQILHEHLPGTPDGIRIWERWHLTWKDGAPFVERYLFKVTGCP